MNTGLSKSKYVTFCNCPKALWLRTYKPDVEVKDSGVESRFETGNKVGDLAMQYFGDFVEVTTIDDNGKLDLTTMIKKTQDEITKDTPVICEASFAYDGNYCAVDILKKNEDGYDIYEVKSSTKIEKDVYYKDIAYQKWLLEKCGLKINNVYLMNINNEYIFDGTLNIQELFKTTLLNKEVEEYYKVVDKNVADAKKILSNNSEPKCPVGEYCFSPYKCGFFKYCTGGLEYPNVFDLFTSSKAIKYYNDEIKTYNQLKDEKLTDNQKKELEAELYDKEFIDKQNIKKFLDSLKYPLYFLDFETMQLVIPEFVGTHPYQQIAFQYSLHILDKPNGTLTHKEYLGESGKNPMEGLAKQLCEDITEDSTVLVYNDVFEKGRLKDMAGLFPAYSERLLKIRENILDLMVPFRSKHYYTKDMQVSYSIKYVLPALFPNDPTLDYHNLEGDVHNGGEAMDLFPKIKDMSKEDQEKARKDLLKYCELDTYAMVKVLEKLYEVVE